MGRTLRYIPPGGALVEVTSRTLHARFLLRPSTELNEIAVGIFARAQKRHPVKIVGLVCMSNHYHALLWVEDASVLSAFMGYVNGNLAREAGRLHGWREKFWARRYRQVWVSDEEAAQVSRLKYLLSQGAKEGLVTKPQDWPGVHCAQVLRDGGFLRGCWFDRTRAAAARKRRKPVDHDTYAEMYELHFDKLPCWDHLSEEEYQERIAGLLEEIDHEARQFRKRNGIVLRSRRAVRRAILKRDPHWAPQSPKREPCPLVHAATRNVRKQLREAYALFVAAFRVAAAALREGNRNASFPEGCFPPGLPFTGPAAARGP